MQNSQCGKEYAHSVSAATKPDCPDNWNKEQAKESEPSNKAQPSLIDTLSVHE